MEINVNLQRIIGFLNDSDNEEYWSSELPSLTDSKISEICDMYMRSDSSTKQILLSFLKQKACFGLSTFSTRMAMLSVRKHSEKMLLDGLVALIIVLDSTRCDRREALMDLSILHNSALKLGDPVRFFHKASEYAEEKGTKEVILNFLERNPENKRIEVMGWEEIKGPSGLIYRFGDQPIPKGHL